MKPPSEGGGDARVNLALASLSFASGCTDVLIFLNLGNVLTSAMTGNTALLAVQIGRGDVGAPSRPLTALIAFSLGVVLAARMNAAWLGQPDRLRVFSRLLLLELVFLTCCSALWTTSPDPIQDATAYTIIALSALSMGVQAVAAVGLSSGVNTVVFTSALVRIMTSITKALSRPEEDAPSLAAIGGYLQTFASYACGALLVAALVRSFPVALIWVPNAMVMLAFGVAKLAGERERNTG